MKWFFVNDGLFEEEKAVLKTGDLALQRGYAAFDYFRLRNNKPLFLDDYLDRFFNSAAEMFITMPLNREQVRKAIFDLIEKNNLPDSGFRMIVTGGYSPDSYTPVKGNFIIHQEPLSMPSEEQFQKGVRIATFNYLRDLPQVKSTNYLMGIWQQKRLKEKHLDDVLYHYEGIITEFPRANVFIINQDRELLTPARNVLAGITRKRLIELASGILPVRTTDITLNALTKACEVFMTSTTKRILPVVEIDGTAVGNGCVGPVTAQLNELFIKQEDERVL
ncbi:MAG TPA: aminotransferase class IV [Niabella sp.]|nr:aminotransferase class IV [Niabella sp.]